MENEVHETFIKDSDPESLAAVARLKRSLFPMYPGVSTPRKKCGKNSGPISTKFKVSSQTHFQAFLWPARFARKEFVAL